VLNKCSPEALPLFHWYAAPSRKHFNPSEDKVENLGRSTAYGSIQRRQMHDSSNRKVETQTVHDDFGRVSSQAACGYALINGYV
jgi:hypothetical protein